MFIVYNIVLLSLQCSVIIYMSYDRPFIYFPVESNVSILGHLGHTSQNKVIL